MCVFHRDVVILCLCNLLLPCATAPRDSNLPLKLIHTLGFQLFLKFCQGVFKLLALLLISHSVTCLLLKIVVKSSHLRPFEFRFLAWFRATHLFNFIVASCSLLIKQVCTTIQHTQAQLRTTHTDTPFFNCFPLFLFSLFLFSFFRGSQGHHLLPRVNTFSVVTTNVYCRLG